MRASALAAGLELQPEHVAAGAEPRTAAQQVSAPDLAALAALAGPT